jgi:putative endonuclease
MTYQKKIGDLGETIAAEYLQKKGYQLLDRHFVTRYGELDLVMSKFESIIFVEVKTRTSATAGMPEENITPSKMEKVQNSALLWLQEHLEAPDDWRIDVVAVLLNKRNQIQDIRHFINVTL